MKANTKIDLECKRVAESLFHQMVGSGLQTRELLIVTAKIVALITDRIIDSGKCLPKGAGQSAGQL